MVKKFFLYNCKFFLKKVKIFNCNFGYTCSDYIFCFVLTDLYNGFYVYGKGIFLIFEIWEKQKIVPGFLKFVSALFLNLKMRISKKLRQVF